jgi:predicted RecB family nuclease
MTTDSGRAPLAGYSLTKETALIGLGCHKSMWWRVHEPMAPELTPSIADDFRRREGRRVGELARSYVPGGRLIVGGPADDPAARVSATLDVLRDMSVPVVYEGAFVANETLVRTDILERRGGAWTLVEVKSATSVSAAEHLPDLAIQAAVVRASGLSVDRYEIMHLNRECRFPDLSNLFVRADATEQVRSMLDDVDLAIVEAVRAVRETAAPEAAIGEHCFKPRDCAFKDRCWPALPKHHVRTLYRIGRKADALIAQGYETIDQLPDDVKLGVVAARQRRAVRQGSIVVERDELVRALAAVERPVAHLDFETVGPAIPRWSGCRPYDQVPVQLSCHVVGVEGATTHHEWLFDGDGDPRPDAARAILAACRGAKTVTAYFSSFEKQCIELVAAACPDDAEELRRIAASLVDLLPIVREHVYHPDFCGSFSLKSVLPALVPEMTYQGLEIAEGGAAQVQLSRLLFDADVNEAERREIRDALLRYCKLDTDAMVALERKLLALV